MDAFIENWPRWLAGRKLRWRMPKLAPHLFRFQFLIRTVQL